MYLPISGHETYPLRANSCIFKLNMKETTERVVKLGLSRAPKKIFDEVDQVTAEMIRQGWNLCDTCIEEGLGNIHLFYERDLENARGGA